MSGIGPAELVVILVIITLLYVLGRLPEFGGALGKGINVSKRVPSNHKAYDD
jgi:sec-independent protein translocase protein TatA